MAAGFLTEAGGTATKTCSHPTSNPDRFNGDGERSVKQNFDGERTQACFRTYFRMLYHVASVAPRYSIHSIFGLFWFCLGPRAFLRRRRNYPAPPAQR